MQTIGEYSVLEKIADGGMGSVYKARLNGDADIVAIKILPPHLAKNPVMCKRFEQEYKTASQLHHKNIVRALSFGFQGKSPYFVMEYVDGDTVGQRLERVKTIPEKEAIRLISQVAQGLHKAHKFGLVHRDVKPDNILLTADGQAKLTDLGLVKEIETDLNLTQSGRGLGTPHFMAPEQFRNAKNADARCDIYSMAATLYMMVTGELPFKACGPLEAWMKKVENKLPAPREVKPELSERIDWAIRRAMHSDPNRRPTTCREFIEDLTGRSTKKMPTLAVKASKDIWHLRFYNDDNVLHSVTASLKSIRRSIKEGAFGDSSNIRASRNQSGPFEPLRTLPEFRDLIMGDVVPEQSPAQNAKLTRPLPKVDLTADSHNQKNGRPEQNSNSDPAAETPLPAKPGASSAVPLIQLHRSDDSSELGRTIVLMLLALLAGAGGFLLFAFLTR